MNRYCVTHGVVPATHKCGRWRNPTTGRKQWIPGWERTRSQALADAGYRCTEPLCDEQATEVHHVTDDVVRAVCYQHNPRGG